VPSSSGRRTRRPCAADDVRPGGAALRPRAAHLPAALFDDLLGLASLRPGRVVESAAAPARRREACRTRPPDHVCRPGPEPRQDAGRPRPRRRRP
jgi:hypothetical protein